MKIAMMVRSFMPVPRPADIVYAPIDLAAAVAGSMARRGHEVDFYAPIGSKVSRVNVEDCNLRPLTNNNNELINLLDDPLRTPHYVPALWDTYMSQRMFKEAAKGHYDVLHFHHMETALPLAHEYPKIPVVYTLHDPAYPFYSELFNLYKSPNQYVVSISNNQRREGPDLPFLTTVYNGVDYKQYSFDSRPEEYLLFVGRIMPEKGVKEAIAVAKATKRRLLIIGPTYPQSQGYFNQYIKPFLDEQILYLGFIERDKIAKYYANARALLTPVQWEEPFGMTTIEAMACGTPVISFNRGAAPEIIKHGKTGYIVGSTAEMIDAVKRVNRLSRAECRRYVERNFSTKKMADGYEDAYEEAILRQEILNARTLPQLLRNIPNKSRLRQIIASSAKKLQQ